MSRPAVSVGLAVYNGARHLAQALDALLAQTFRDFELVISDNASTDATPEICRRYAAADPRIVLHRQPANLGAVRNFETVRDLARAELFMWAAHDDLWHPEYVAACVEALSAHPGAVLCSSQATVIDLDGRDVGAFTEDMTTLGLPPLGRLARVLEVLAHNIQFYGLTRTAACRAIRLRSHYGFDHAYTAELSLHGAFITLPRRLFRSRTGGTHASADAIMRAQNIRCWWTRHFPTASFLVSFLRDAAGWKELSAADRGRAMRLVLRRFAGPVYRRRMRDELVHAARFPARRLRPQAAAGGETGGRP